MTKKSNIRSIRFSDELAELIDRQIGDTFTQKFENLITRCVWELPQKEEQLKRIQEQIDREQQRLAELQKTKVQLTRLRMYIDQAEDYIKLVMGTTRDIAETTTKEEA